MRAVCLARNVVEGVTVLYKNVAIQSLEIACALREDWENGVKKVSLRNKTLLTFIYIVFIKVQCLLLEMEVSTFPLSIPFHSFEETTLG